MEKIIKISQATFEDVKGLVISPDNTDSFVEFDNETKFIETRSEIMDRYGDVTISINRDPSLFLDERLTILDDKWQRDKEEFYRNKYKRDLKRKNKHNYSWITIKNL